MRRSRGPIIGLGFTMLAACSTVEWVHPNKPSGEFVQDYNKCETDVLRDPKLQQGSRFMVEEATEQCLRKQGWIMRQKR